MMRARACDGAEVIQVIRTRAIAGSGTGEDVVREVVQYWSLDGDLIATVDPCAAP